MRADDLMSPEEVSQVQERLGQLAVAVADIDLDAFLALAAMVSSPQAAARGMSLRAVESAGAWVELATLLKPFRDEALRRVEQIRREEA